MDPESFVAPEATTGGVVRVRKRLFPRTARLVSRVLFEFYRESEPTFRITRARYLIVLGKISRL
jgi:hypothetical protein